MTTDDPTLDDDQEPSSLRQKLEGRLDGVLIISGMYIHPDILVMLRAIDIRTAMLLTESPYDQEHEAMAARYVDVGWTNERSSVEFLREHSDNPHITYLPHAYDPALHTPTPSRLDAQVPAHDVVFVGTCFRERVEALDAVDWTDVDLGLYGSWDMLPKRHRLRQYVRGDVIDNAQAAALYRRAKIGLNLYRTSKGFGYDGARVESADSLNPRALELAACGTFQISDYRAEVREVFEGTVMTCADLAELNGMIRTMLSMSGERASLAQHARQAIQQHTFAARAEQIVDDMQRVWQCAPEAVAA